jgi:hypothetical protein
LTIRKKRDSSLGSNRALTFERERRICVETNELTVQPCNMVHETKKKLGSSCIFEVFSFLLRKSASFFHFA